MSDEFKDFLIDKELKIKTTGRNEKHADTRRYPYEPTSYTVMDRMIESEYISKDDVIIDYGSGMGRVPIYLNYMMGIKGIGIEFVKEFYKEACNNAKQNGCQGNVEFINAKAEEYELPDSVTVCFFFNPFDIGIFRGVMKHIISSYYNRPRRIRLFFYYPQDEYIAFLMSVPEIEFVDEIDCMDLFEKDDDRNRIMIFETVI